MGELGRLIEDYKDRAATRDPFRRRPSNADIGRTLGVGRSTVHHWTAGKMPGPEHIGPLARAIDTPYPRVLAAALSDAGYLAREADVRDAEIPTMTQAGGSPAIPREQIVEHVTAALEQYFKDADRVLERQTSRRARDALLAQLRTGLVQDLSDRLAGERPDSGTNVG